MDFIEATRSGHAKTSLIILWLAQKQAHLVFIFISADS